MLLSVFGTSAHAIEYNKGRLPYESIYYQMHTPITHTGTTTATTIHSITVPPGTLSENGTIIIITGWSYEQNDANTKTCAVLAQNTVLTSINGANNRSSRIFTSLHNANSLTAQIAPPSGITGFGLSTAQLQSLSIDTLSPWTISWRVTLANPTNTVTLRAIEMFVYP